MRPNRIVAILTAVIAFAALTTNAQAQRQPLRLPVNSNNVLFLDANGEIVYGVAGLHVTDFLGVPVVGGTLWERRTNTRYAFAAVQTANRNKWVWLTNDGPAGTATNGDRFWWADNRGNRGVIVPL